jgi:hypothetical protein
MVFPLLGIVSEFNLICQGGYSISERVEKSL